MSILSVNRLASSRVSAATLLVLFLGLAMVPRVVEAQELYGTFYGSVTDPDGAPLPGVAVTVAGPSLLGDVTVVTNQRGVYRAAALPPGSYTVQFTLQGFTSLLREDLEMVSGASLAVDVMLPLSGVAELITVTGETPLVDVKSAQNKRTTGVELLENIPIGRHFSDMVLTAPGSVSDTYERSPLQSIQGQHTNSNLYNVDGARATEARGTAIQNIPFGSIQEMQMTTGGISAEYGQVSGAVFNFITKSGGNNFHGEANFYYQDDGLQSDNLSEELLAQGLTQGSEVVLNQEFSLHLGGPVIRDRVWFFGHYLTKDFDKINPSFTATTPTVDDREYFFKLTSQLAPRLKLVTSYSDRVFVQFPANASFSTNDDPQTWDQLKAPHQIFNAGVTWVVSDNTIIDTQFSWAAQRFDRQQQNPDGTFVEARTQNSELLGYRDIVTGFLSGGYTRPEGKFQERDTWTFKPKISHFADDGPGGSHNLKAGFEYIYNPTRWVRTIPGALLHLLSNGEPHRIRLYNTPNYYKTDYSRLGVFLQDDWTVGDRLTLNLGVRFSKQKSWLPEQEGGGGPWFDPVQFSERELIDNTSWSPRFGLAYDLADGRAALRASVARTQGVLRSGANANTVQYQEYDWVDDGDLVFEDGEQGTLRRDFATREFFFAEDLHPSYTDAFDIGVDWQLGDDVVVQVSGVYKKEQDIIGSVYRDAASPFDGYVPIDVTSPLDGSTLTIYALDPAFQGVSRTTILTNPDNPGLFREYKGLEISAKKRLRDGWQFQGSLSIGSAEGNIGNNFSGRTSLLNPNNLVNFEGANSLSNPVQLKLSGSYLAPWDIMVGGFYQYYTGHPIQDRAAFSPGTQTPVLGSPVCRFFPEQHPEIIVESFVQVACLARGSERFGAVNLLSLRAEKRFEIGRANLGVVFDVFNALNINPLLAVESLLVGNPNFMKPSVIQSPRAFRLGARLSF